MSERPEEIDEKDSWGFEEGHEIWPGRIALSRLGGGEQYEVYLAWDERLFSLVVVKVIRLTQVKNESSLRSLAREADLLDRLAHPGLVRSLGGVLTGQRPHLVLEHIEGPRLSSLIRRHGALQPAQFLPLALHLCSVCHYLAAEGFVHLDIKPSNTIMAAPPRLIDLSVARTTSEASKLQSPVGTDPYMAPEQCEPGWRKVDGAADIWGLGVTMYEAITGERPFPDGDSKAHGPKRWTQLELEPMPFPSRFPRELTDPIMQCMAEEPAERPSASSLALSLEPLVATLPRRPVLGRPRPRSR